MDKIVGKATGAKRISCIQFGLLSPNEMAKLAEFQVTSRELYKMPARKPAPNGCLDQRLGVTNKVAVCETCQKKVTDCAGHFGYIKLELPVFHIGYFKHVLTILQCICKQCAAVLLTEPERETNLRRMRNPRADALMKTAMYKRVVERCKKVSKCPACGAHNGSVKKVAGSATLKLVHERYKGKHAADEFEALAHSMRSAMGHNKDIAMHVTRAQEDLSPLFVIELFKRISDEDCELLWLEPSTGRPEHLLLTSVLVPPAPIRPSIVMDVGAGSNEDDLTIKLQEIIDVNNALKIALSKGAGMKMIMEDWNFLQVQVAQYINGEMPGLPRPIGASKPIRGLCQRLKGKSGRFRGNLSGKRVDFSGRTVISPDPNLKIEQVGVPFQVAMTMTYPEMVSRYNVERLRVCVINGPKKHPGANYIRPQGDGTFNRSLLYGDREKMASELQIGDIVERHMDDGDVVLFNRQPSLHKLSIMSHRVKVMPWRTFRFNECVCAPYNADFDGDEMNMHLPQTEEARAEAATLMAVTANQLTPRNGEPLVAATQDFLTGGYLITQRNVFFNRELFCTLAGYLADAGEHIDIPPPTILKPVALWTGKQIISLLVKPRRTPANGEPPVLANLTLKERNYTEGGPLCRNDGYVIFRNSELLCGNLAKKTLGDGTKKGLFYVLLRDHGAAEAARCMNRLAKLVARYLGGHKGFSIGIEDVTPSRALLDLKARLLAEGYSNADSQIRDYESGIMQLKPGCNATQSLESELTGILGKVRESAGKEAMRALPWVNSPRIMADCGSKGSVINISQMIACLGQQAVDGKRIQNGFVHRTLPHFQPKSLSPAAKGFVQHSFYDGLAATEFFMHTMGGREGLVDTAVKTAQTGYMARRLMKALEDLSMQYDGSVRNSETAVVQFTYGDDGLNPTAMEGADRPVEFSRLLENVTTVAPCIDEEPLSSPGLRAMLDETLASERFVNLLPQGLQFHEEIGKFLGDIITNIEQLTDKLVACEAAAEAADGDAAPAGPNDDSGSNAEEAKKPSSSKASKASNAKRDKAKAAGGGGGLGPVSRGVLKRVHRVTRTQIEQFVSAAFNKYELSHVEPGQAVGAIGAQSISEPGTQMTLKTFHFAGVASMNVTLGVPRLTEIINASKAISTPIITARLVQDDNKTSARVVKAQIEKTTLGEIAHYIKEVYAPDACYLSVKLDMEAVRALHLGIDAHTVRRSIMKGCPGQTRPVILRQLKEQHITVQLGIGGAASKLRIFPPEHGDKSGGRSLYFLMQGLKAALPQVIVQGLPTISRAVVNEEQVGSQTKYHLLVEGYGLAEVMGAPGVDGTNTRSNHIIEVEATLGVEAARTMITEEISYIMSAYGISIDRRHLMLLSDVMTFKGEVLGITRFGVSKMKESVMMLASFEKTTDHLFDAAVHGRTDNVVGVSECIIMGQSVPLGSGLFKLLRSRETQNYEPTRAPDLLLG